MNCPWNNIIRDLDRNVAVAMFSIIGFACFLAGFAVPWFMIGAFLCLFLIARELM